MDLSCFRILLIKISLKLNEYSQVTTLFNFYSYRKKKQKIKVWRRREGRCKVMPPLHQNYTSFTIVSGFLKHLCEIKYINILNIMFYFDCQIQRTNLFLYIRIS